jgi:hypothetical protein
MSDLIAMAYQKPKFQQCHFHMLKTPNLFEIIVKSIFFLCFKFFGNESSEKSKIIFKKMYDFFSHHDQFPERFNTFTTVGASKKE